MRNYSVTVKIDGLPKLINQSSFNNWRAVYGERKKWKEKVARAFVCYQPPEPLIKAAVKVIRYSSRSCDWDNGVASLKAIWDGLKLAKIIKDDNQSVIIKPEFEWRKAPPKQGYIEVIVQSLE